MCISDKIWCDILESRPFILKQIYNIRMRIVIREKKKIKISGSVMMYRYLIEERLNTVTLNTDIIQSDGLQPWMCCQ